MGTTVEVKEIRKYSYMVYSSRCGAEDVKAVIMINGDTEFLGYLNFMTDGCQLPKTVKNSGLFFAYYHYRDMPAIIDMLRNEKPIYFIFMDDNFNNCRIGTMLEPAGEGEQ